MWFLSEAYPFHSYNALSLTVDETPNNHGDERGTARLPSGLQAVNCSPAAIEEFPKWPLDSNQRANGGIALNIIITLYLVAALAVVCDDYFVPALEMICDGFKVRQFCTILSQLHHRRAYGGEVPL